MCCNRPIHDATASAEQGKPVLHQLMQQYIKGGKRDVASLSQWMLSHGCNSDAIYSCKLTARQGYCNSR